MICLASRESVGENGLFHMLKMCEGGSGLVCYIEISFECLKERLMVWPYRRDFMEFALNSMAKFVKI